MHCHTDGGKNRIRFIFRQGGGIVADSIPEKEYEESGHKARALMEALEKAHEIE